MTAQAGRRVRLHLDGVYIGAARTKTVTINNEAIDISTDDDVGFRALLDSDPASRAIDMSVEGILKDSFLVNKALAAGDSLMVDGLIEFDGIADIAGQFYMSSLELGAPYNDGVTFSASLQSSGAFAAVST